MKSKQMGYMLSHCKAPTRLESSDLVSLWFCQHDHVMSGIVDVVTSMLQCLPAEACLHGI